MLTGYYKESLDEIRLISELFKSDIVKNQFMTWGHPDYQEFHGLQHYRMEAGKNFFKHVILDWLGDIVGTVRFETFRYNEFGYNLPERVVYIHSVGLTNHVGSLENKGVLNKVYLFETSPNWSGKYEVRTHKARTDKNYLHPFEDNFLNFFQECMDYLNR
jgi:hypothetical protein